MPAPSTDDGVLTVAFLDLASSSRIAARMTPRPFLQLVREVLRECIAAVETCAGQVDRVLGDGLLARFDPAPDAPGAALAAVRACWLARHRLRATDRRWRARGISDQLRLRCGIATGPCAVGVLGTGACAQVTCIGQTVHLAERLLSTAQPDDVVVCPETAHLLAPHVGLESIGPRDLKGFGARLPVHRVTSLLP